MIDKVTFETYQIKLFNRFLSIDNYQNDISILRTSMLEKKMANSSEKLNQKSSTRKSEEKSKNKYDLTA